MILPRASMGLLLPAHLFEPLGRVIASWACFEAELDQAIALMRHNETAREAIPHPAVIFNKRIEAFKTAAELCFSGTPSLRDKLVTLSTEAKLVSQDRNVIAHGRWDFRDRKVFAWFVKKGVEHERELSPDFLKEVSTGIGCLTSQVRLILWADAVDFRHDDDPLTPDERNASQIFRESTRLLLSMPSRGAQKAPRYRD